MKKIIFLVNAFLISLTINSQTVTTLAGTGTPGTADGIGGLAQFHTPSGVAVDAAGNVYVADFYNHKIRKITSTGVVTTLAGTGVAGFANGDGAVAQFENPTGIAIDASGNVFVAEQGNHKIRKITPDGLVSTFAGNAMGFAEGPIETAQFMFPTGVVVDASGTMYVADQGNNRIRKITTTGIVSTLAGSAQGFSEGMGEAAHFDHPTGVAVDAAGNIYVADIYNHRIRKITPDGVVSTFAGSGIVGAADGATGVAQFNRPSGVAIDANGIIYVSDWYNHKIRKIMPAGMVTTLSGSGTAGFVDGASGSAQFNRPYGLAVETNGGVVYVADFNNNSVRKVTQLLGITQSAATHIKLCPNPNNGVFSIQTTNPEAKSISIFTILGQEIYTVDITSNETNVDISNQSKGIYLYEITSANGILQSGKIIID